MKKRERERQLQGTVFGRAQGQSGGEVNFQIELISFHERIFQRSRGWWDPERFGFLVSVKSRSK